MLMIADIFPQQISEKRPDGSLNEAVRYELIPLERSIFEFLLFIIRCRQIALADLLLVNKTDLVTGDALKDVCHRVQ